MNLLEELKAVTEALLDREEIEYALCGGLAMAVYDLLRTPQERWR